MTLKHNIDQITGLETALSAIDQGILITGNMLDALADATPIVEGKANEYFPAKKTLIVDGNAQVNSNQNLATSTFATNLATLGAKVEEVKVPDRDALVNSIGLTGDSLNNVSVMFESAKQAVIGGELDEAHDTLGELKDYIETTLDVDTEITEYIAAKKAAFLSSLSGVVEDGLNTLKEIHDAVPAMVTAIETAGDEAQAALDVKVTELRYTVLNIDSFKTMIGEMQNPGAINAASAIVSLNVATIDELNSTVTEKEAIVAYESVPCTTTDGVTSADFSAPTFTFNAVRELGIAELNGDLVEVLLIADSATPGIYEVPAELDGVEITVPTYVRLPENS